MARKSKYPFEELQKPGDSVLIPATKAAYNTTRSYASRKKKVINIGLLD